MLKALRWKLTLLYLFAALALVAIGGFGTYLLIDHYFQQTTDLALQYKMALEFRILGLPVPKALEEAETLWLQNNQNIVSPVSISDSFTKSDDDHEHDDDDDDDKKIVRDDYVYNADLAAIFVILLDENGYLITVPGVPVPPMVDSANALLTVQETGYDMRTIDVAGQGRVRLLSYRTGANVPAILQVGRLLNDQDRVLEQYLTYLGFFGGLLSILLSFISWLLAGRSLGPAQKAFDQQQTFVSNASHELRTPLTFIRATADYRLRLKPPAEEAEHLENILNECDYMDRLVDDLLLLTRLDANRLQLDLDLLSLSELFAEILTRVKRRAETEGITLISGGYDGDIYVDHTRIRQVLLILLDNALRFTPTGGKIELTAEKSGKSILIKVSDTGKGVDPKHLPHLFDRFYQVGTPENAENRSNGLGLSIARTLIEAHHGTIKVESKLGQGAHFTIALPDPKS